MEDLIHDPSMANPYEEFFGESTTFDKAVNRLDTSLGSSARTDYRPNDLYSSTMGSAGTRSINDQYTQANSSAKIAEQANKFAGQYNTIPGNLEDMAKAGQDLVQFSNTFTHDPSQIDEKEAGFFNFLDDTSDGIHAQAVRALTSLGDSAGNDSHNRMPVLPFSVGAPGLGTADGHPDYDLEISANDALSDDIIQAYKVLSPTVPSELTGQQQEFIPVVSPLEHAAHRPEPIIQTLGPDKGQPFWFDGTQGIPLEYRLDPIAQFARGQDIHTNLFQTNEEFDEFMKRVDASQLGGNSVWEHKVLFPDETAKAPADFYDTEDFGY